MAKEKVETKIAFLLSPLGLAKDYMLLESFHIHKSAKGIEYETYDIDFFE